MSSGGSYMNKDGTTYKSNYGTNPNSRNLLVTFDVRDYPDIYYHENVRIYMRINDQNIGIYAEKEKSVRHIFTDVNVDQEAIIELSDKNGKTINQPLPVAMVIEQHEIKNLVIQFKRLDKNYPGNVLINMKIVNFKDLPKPNELNTSNNSLLPSSNNRYDPYNSAKKVNMSSENALMSTQDLGSSMGGLNFSDNKNSNRQLNNLSSVNEEKREPVDLGQEWYNDLRKTHEKAKGVKQYTEENLVDTWKQLHKSKKMNERNHQKSKVDQTMGWGYDVEKKKRDPEAWKRLTGGSAVMQRSNVPSEKDISDKDFFFKRSVRSIDGQISHIVEIYIQDVKKTVYKYHQNTQEDANRLKKMELIILQRDREKKVIAAEKAKKKKQSEIMKKLWGESGKPPQKKGEDGITVNYEQSDNFESMTQDPRWITVNNMRIDKYHWQVEGTCEVYHKDFPEDHDYVYPGKLFDYWVKMDPLVKQKNQLTCDTATAQVTFDNYFMTRIQYLFSEFKNELGYTSYNGKAMFNFYQNTWPEEKKADTNMYFPSSTNAKKLFDYYLKRFENKKNNELKNMSKQSPIKEEKGKKITMKQLEEAAGRLNQPKDKFKRGKVLLGLSLKFPKDRLLKEMAVREFEDYKMNQSTVDWEKLTGMGDDQVTSEMLHHGGDVLKMKEKKEKKTLKNFSKAGMASDPYDDAPKKREKRDIIRQWESLLEMFKNDPDLVKYKNAEGSTIDEKDKQKQGRKEDEYKIKKYIKRVALEYKKYKMDPQTEQFHIFLDEKYKKMIELYKQSEKMYPKLNIGTRSASTNKLKTPALRQDMAKSQDFGKGSSKNQATTYPMPFKYDVMEQSKKIERQAREEVEKKVVDWIPSGATFKSKTHISEKQAEANLELQQHQIKKDGAWEECDYNAERQQIMMKFDDAQNCTFNPTLGWKIPTEWQEMAIRKYNFSTDFYKKPETSKEAINSFIERAIEDPHRKFNAKMGTFKRAALLYYSKGNIKEAYQRICESFNVNYLREVYLKNELLNAPVKKKAVYDRLQKSLMDNKVTGQSSFKHSIDISKRMEDHKNELKTSEIIKEEKKPEAAGVKVAVSHKQSKPPCVSYPVTPAPPANTTLGIILGSKVHEYDEETGNAQREPFLREVFELVLIQESEQKQFTTQIREINDKNKFDDFDLEDQYNKDKKVKEFMCPLGLNCPSYRGDRWPVSDKNKGINPIGHNCPLAHHPFELYFTSQKRRDERLRENLKQKLGEKKRTLVGEGKAWKTAGQMNFCPAKCGKCNYCKFKEKADSLEKDFMEKGKSRNFVVKDPYKREKKNNSIMETANDNMCKKVGYYRRALVLFSKERFKDAYETLIKAIEILRDEDYEAKVAKYDMEQKLKKKLGLELEEPINEKMVFEKAEELRLGQLGDANAVSGINDFKDDQSNRDWDDQKYQKIYYLAKRMGKLSDKNASLDAQQYLKDCVEALFWKIESKFVRKDLGIEAMRTRATKLEDRLEDDDFFDQPNLNPRTMSPNKARRVRLDMKKTEMCHYVEELGFCPNMPYCTKAHNPTELDVIGDKLKQNNLNKAIDANTNIMKESNATLPWRYTGFKDVVESQKDEENLRRYAALKKLTDEEKEMEQMRRITEKKSVYEKNPDWIKKLPYDRKGEDGNDDYDKDYAS